MAAEMLDIRSGRRKTPTYQVQFNSHEHAFNFLK